MLLNEVERRSFTHKGVAYDALFFVDANEPHVVSFEVLSSGKRVPLNTAGIGRTFVRFSVSLETIWDAKLADGECALDMLYDEARQMVVTTY